jgi:hypothetical protein
MTAAILDSLEQLQSAVDDFLKHAEHGGFGVLSDEEFGEVAREVEAIRRQLETVDYPIVAEVEARALSDKALTRNPAGLLSGLWRITPTEAAARVREAAALGPRATMSGEVLEPVRPATAQARRLGILSGSQVAVITRALDELPRDLPVGEVAAAERTLVQAAHTLHPGDLRKVAIRLKDTVNPDGATPSEAEQARRREFWLTREHDGMVRFGGTLDAVTGAKAEAFFGAHAKPRPDDASGRDERTPAQRRHDAFADLLDLGFRSGQFRTATGAPVMVHVTMSAEQFTTGTGHTITSYRQPIRVAQALRMADQCALAWLVHDSTGSVLAHGRSRRLASRAQAEALLVRDGGCAFPGCDHPAEWAERHHVKPWLIGGPTDIDNLVLLCSYHHRRFEHQGWEIRMRAGVPWFIPPPFIDPTRTPIRNHRGLRAGVP